MRKFEFRCWDKKRKIMLPSYSVDENGEWCCDSEYTNTCERTSKESLIQMQYTGLKDENDKEIYEGDILKINHKTPYTYDCETKEHFSTNVDVFWNEELACFDMDQKYLQQEAFMDDLYSLGAPFNTEGMPNFKSYEVIGNIYENPELLKPEE